MKYLKITWYALCSTLFYLGLVVSVFVYYSYIIPRLKIPGLAPKDLKGRYKILITWAHFVFRWLGFCCGIKYQVTGLENVPATPCVILAKHQSMWETLCLPYLLQPTTFVLKQELMRIPLFNTGLALAEPIVIDRSQTTAAARKMLKEGTERLSKGYNVLIFPEGTRVAPREWGRIKPTGARLACNAKVPILPIVHNAGEHWGAKQFIKYPGTIQIIIGAPLESNDQTPQILSKTVEQWMKANYPNPQG